MPLELDGMCHFRALLNGLLGSFPRGKKLNIYYSLNLQTIAVFFSQDYCHSLVKGRCVVHFCEETHFA